MRTYMQAEHLHTFENKLQERARYVAGLLRGGLTALGEGKKLTPTRVLWHTGVHKTTQNKQINEKILRTPVKVDHTASQGRWYTHPGQAQQCSGSIKLKSICLEDKHIGLKQGPLERIHNLGVSDAQSKCWPRILNAT